MSNANRSHIELIDTTAQFRPEKVYKSSLKSYDGAVFESESEKKEFFDKIQSVYTNLAHVAEDMFAVTMPEFNEDMIQYVSFQGELKPNKVADHNPESGLIRLSSEKNKNWLTIVKNMAHEICHFAAKRKLFTNGKEELPARVGISVIRNRIASRDNAEEFAFDGYRGAVFNEALTEISAAEMVNQIKDMYDFIPHEGVEPETYTDERRLYASVVEAIAHSWNNTDLRERIVVEREIQKVAATSREDNRKMMGVMKKRLGWQDSITEEQVKELFHDALTEGDGITKIAQLVNMCFGSVAFEVLWDAKPERTNIEAWKIIDAFIYDKAYKREDLDFPFNGTVIHINSQDADDRVIFHSFDYLSESKIGIEDIFREYEKLLKSPIERSHIELFAERVHQQRRSRTTEYSFNLSVLHEVGNTGAISKMGKPTLNFCFEQLKEVLDVSDVPSEITSIDDIPNTVYRTQLFECRNSPGLKIARVEIADTSREESSVRYFFVK